MYKFFFTYEGGDVMIPISGETEEIAKTKLRNYLGEWSNQLVPSAPVLSPEQLRPLPEPPSISPMALELRIEELIKDVMPIKKPKNASSMERLVKDWTGFSMESQNYPAIISELEKIKNGRID